MVQRLALRGEGKGPERGQQRPHSAWREGRRPQHHHTRLPDRQREGWRVPPRRPTGVARHRLHLAGGRLPLDRDRHGRALGRQEPVLCLFPIPSGRHPCRRGPLLEPLSLRGHPSVADPQSLVFAPPIVLWALFDPEPSIRTFDLIVYAHLGLGGLAVGALGWRAGWPAAASILAAAIFMFGGPASGRLQHTGIILSYGLFPAALLLMQMALQRRSMAIAGAFAVVAAMLALGRRRCSCASCWRRRSWQRSPGPRTSGLIY